MKNKLTCCKFEGKQQNILTLVIWNNNLTSTINQHFNVFFLWLDSEGNFGELVHINWNQTVRKLHTWMCLICILFNGMYLNFFSCCWLYKNQGNLPSIYQETTFQIVKAYPTSQWIAGTKWLMNQCWHSTPVFGAWSKFLIPLGCKSIAC